MCIFDGFCFRVSRVLQKVIQLGCSLSGRRDGESDEDHPRGTQPLVQACCIQELHLPMPCVLVHRLFDQALQPEPRALRYDRMSKSWRREDLGELAILSNSSPYASS